MHERCNEFNVFLTRNPEIEKVKRTHSFDRKCRGKKDGGNQKEMVDKPYVGIEPTTL